MAELTITTFVSLDGVMQAPGGPTEDTTFDFRHGGWVIPLFDEIVGAFMVDTFRRAEAFLLGRGTYEIFATHWPKVEDPQDPIAGPLNRLPKYVASRTLATADWAGSTVVRDPIADLPGLKARHTGEIQVHGSAGLARALLATGLVDELRLITFPVVLGRGKRLFGDESAAMGLTLVESKVSGTGVVTARYRRAGEVQIGTAPPPV